MTDDPKCDACNLIENLKPCGFCGQPVVIRYNKNTGVHYISHEDWNSGCPQRPFYGSAEQWNTRFAEDTLRAENERLRLQVITLENKIESLDKANADLAQLARQKTNNLCNELQAKTALDAAGGQE